MATMIRRRKYVPLSLVGDGKRGMRLTSGMNEHATNSDIYE